MACVYLGDIHLGYSRKSFTTKQGAARYRTALYEAVTNYCRELRGGMLVQVGDLFDSFRTDDLATVQGLHLLSEQLDFVVAGNHDLVNTAGKDSTLAMLADYCESSGSAVYGDILMPEYNKPTTSQIPPIICQKTGKKIKNYVVPYQYTQELFESSLDSVLRLAGKRSTNEVKVLVLHTNYDNPFDNTETTNNLTEEKAKELLKHFDYIVSGHHHNYSEHLRGRVVMTGAIMPFNSSEYEDKYAVKIDGEGVKKMLLWKASDHVRTYTPETAPETLPDNIQFVITEGSTTEVGHVELMKKISNWWNTSTSLLTCIPRHEIRVTDDTESLKAANSLKGVNVVDVVRGVLKGRSLEVFDSVVAELKGKE